VKVTRPGALRGYAPNSEIVQGYRGAGSAAPLKIGRSGKGRRTSVVQAFVVPTLSQNNAKGWGTLFRDDVG